MSGLLRKTCVRLSTSSLPCAGDERLDPGESARRPLNALPAASTLVFVGERLFVAQTNSSSEIPCPPRRHWRTALTQLAREQTRVIEIAEAGLALDQPFQPRRIDAYERHRQPPSRIPPWYHQHKIDEPEDQSAQKPALSAMGPDKPSCASIKRENSRLELSAQEAPTGSNAVANVGWRPM